MQQEKNIIELDCQEQRGGNGMAWMQLNQFAVLVWMVSWWVWRCSWSVRQGSMDCYTEQSVSVEYLQ